MHAEAMAFLQKTLKRYKLDGKRVLEIGSYDVNGTARVLFPAEAEYVGIDRRPGRGVDWVVDARYFDGRGEFDIVITTETLEHDPEPQEIIDCAERALKTGGLLVITCATTGRKPHGNNGGPVLEGEHFGAVSPSELEEMLSGWERVKIEHNPEMCDVYATARKARA